MFSTAIKNHQNVVTHVSAFEQVQGNETLEPNETSEPKVSLLPITIYLSDEAPHGDVQAAVEELLGTAGLTILGREAPIIGSWFRRMWATMSPRHGRRSFARVP